MRLVFCTNRCLVACHDAFHVCLQATTSAAAYCFHQLLPGCLPQCLQSVCANYCRIACHTASAGYDERGFVFYTNYNSRKGQELAAGGRTALAFWWEGLQRQVRHQGAAAAALLRKSDCARC